ncbi:hypothetical protein [Selenomonas sp.]|uniref:hypothetical protein n=1 Tax=Selenomonas sp. TaxID=2053611 RepID=UPI002A8344CB|nr:hypothetical protein [Selenomonas sp.]MDY4417328.1 hypothetical protein [Selenomonas sp.]
MRRIPLPFHHAVTLPFDLTRRRLVGAALAAVFGLALAIFLMLELLSYGAAGIFNQVAASQDLLRGHVRVEKLFAHINGHVRFEGLVWTDDAGSPVLIVPEGEFYVKPWDVLTGHLSAHSLTSISLTDAAVSLHIRNDPQTKKPVIDFVTPSTEFFQMMAAQPPAKKIKGPQLTPEERKERAERARAAREAQMAREWSNFNHTGKRIDCDLTLHHAKVEIAYEKRHYLLQGANMNADLHSDGLTTIDLTTGGFGGTMIGHGVSMKGTIDCRSTSVPEVNLSILASEVDPSSLGFGMDIHDPMTLTAHFVGPITGPAGTGEVRMAELHIPGLAFTDVKGYVDYHGSTLDFTDVTAGVYGGSLVAEGTYDLDSRVYHLEGHGENLQAAKALPGQHLKCSVTLDIAIDSQGSPQQTVTSGTFVSGPGSYHILFFDKLSGRFTDRFHDLQFYDADIELAGAHVKTDTFRIKNKKLTLAPVYVYDENGQLLMVYNKDDKILPET